MLIKIRRGQSSERQERKEKDHSRRHERRLGLLRLNLVVDCSSDGSGEIPVFFRWRFWLSSNASKELDCDRSELGR